MRLNGLAVLALTAGLAACGSNEGPASAPTEALTPTGTASYAGAARAGKALASLLTADGKPAGKATVTATVAGVELVMEAEGLPPGPHGIHVHTVGLCDAPKFTTAGAHWNPAGMQHGLDNPAGQHAGDMSNLVIGADGKGTVSYALKGATLEGLLDEDGSAIVVHAKADDQKTDPSGDSGDRIACGVFSPG